MGQKIKIADLVPHENNSFYFDDIEGDAWNEFLESIRTSGVIEPIVVTQNRVIVSGHQRVRACKTLGIEEIEAEVRIFDNDDEILKQLLETNIRQRGIGNTNPVKFGRCLMELERIYGIKNGNNQHDSRVENNFQPTKTQTEMADELGITVQTLGNYKRLAQAIPEVQELVESGKVSKTVALRLLRELSEDEQKQLAMQLSGSDEKFSDREVEFYKKRVTSLTEENEKLRNKRAEVKEVEVVPDDYEDIKEQLAQADAENAENVAEIKKLRGEVDGLKKDLTDKAKELKSKATQKPDATSAKMFVAQCRNFMDLVKAQENILPDSKNAKWGDRHDCIEVLTEISDWASDLVKKISGG